MSSQPTSTQNAEAATPPTQNRVVQKVSFRQPRIGPLRHVLQVTGQSGKSKEYDSYSDNRP
jgi:hypothetical protein